VGKNELRNPGRNTQYALDEIKTRRGRAVGAIMGHLGKRTFSSEEKEGLKVHPSDRTGKGKGTGGGKGQVHRKGGVTHFHCGTPRGRVTEGYRRHLGLDVLEAARIQRKAG